MRRSQYRRATKGPKWLNGKRRIIAAAATLVAFGGIVTVTQVSDAATKRSTDRALAACDRIQAPRASKLSSETKKGTYTQNKGKVTQHSDDGAGDVPTAATLRTRCRKWVMQNAGNNGGNNNGGNNNGGGNAGQPSPGASSSTGTGGQNGGGQNGGGQNGGGQNGGGNNGGGQATPPPGAGLGILTNTCDDSQLEPHDGFQNGNRCVSTEFGEVGTRENNPTLLITDAPGNVDVGQAFALQVSTRNLIRDRFLAAGQGGYYVESSVLNNGIVRGHFHTACRILANTNEAPDPNPVPEFFVATEDRQGGQGVAASVAIQIPGLPTAGEYQCSSWAGDGSHRIPMMQAANETPAFDSVRVVVGNNGGDQGGDQGDQGGDQAGDQGDQAGGDQAAGDQAGNQQQNGRQRG